MLNPVPRCRGISAFVLTICLRSECVDFMAICDNICLINQIKLRGGFSVGALNASGHLRLSSLLCNVHLSAIGPVRDRYRQA